MIQIDFKGPEQKSFIVPTNKSVVKEKEKQRRIKKQKEKEQKQLMENIKKVTHILKTPQKTESVDIKLLKFILNATDPKDYTKKEEIKKPTIEENLEETEQPEIIKKTDFLNTAEYQELKDRYSDYNFGEYVIKFPNPDYEKTEDKPITMEEAERVFDTQLAIVAEGGIPQSLLKKQKQAFLRSFLQLDDYVEKDPEKIKKNKELAKKKAQAETIFNKENKKKKENDNKDMIQYKKYIERYRAKNEEDVDEEVEIIESSKQPNNSQFKVQMKSKSKLDAQQQKDSGEQQIDQIKDFSTKQPMNSEGNEEEQLTMRASEDQLKYLSELRVTKIQNYSELQKQYCKGGYLFKRYTDDKTDYDWVQMQLIPKDFLTLVRHTIILKLTRDAHFHCRQFISSDDQSIFLVIKSNLNKIKQVAESSRLYKQYELGYADILSLEPCDKSLRPLRLKQYIRDPDFAEKAEDFIQEEKNQDKTKKRLQRIDSEAQKIYQKVMKWGDQELRGNIVVTQNKLDPLIKRMAQELHISLNQDKVTILYDDPTSREAWEAYHIYQLYLIDYLDRVYSGDQFKEIQYNRGFLFKLIFRKAVGDTNEYYRAFHSGFWNPNKILQTLWDRQGIPPISPYGQYFSVAETQSLWRKFEVNEKGFRSEFMNVEKLKIANSIVSYHINIKKLIENQLVLTYFAIHDPYQLLGMPKASFFKPLIDIQLIKVQELTPGQHKLNDLFVSLKDEAEGADFDGQSLLEEARFNYFPPWKLPIDVIRDYYGEKVALYFKFLQFYTSQIWNIVIAAIICEGIIDNTEGDSKKAFLIIFAVFLITWSSYFLSHWRRQQVLFQIEFGQQFQSEANEVERPAFEGNFIRSIMSDKLNDEVFPLWKKQIRLGTSFTITFLLIAMVIASVLGVFFLKSYLIDNYPDNNFLVGFVPSMINAIVIQIFNTVYFIVSTILNYKENHKYESEYENSLIMKTFSFTFINTFNCLAIIAFLDTTFPNLQLCKTADGLNCYRALKDQMVTIFMVNFAKTLPQIIVPCLKGFLRSETKKVDENLVPHEFNQIDQYIENQGDLEPYISNAETDGLMNDYMELVVQFAFLQLFGLAFPLSYFIAFVTNIAQIQVDKLKLIHFMQRPTPCGARDIGNWLFILEIIAFLSIFCNAGLIVFTSNSIWTAKSPTFAAFVLCFLGLKYFSSIIISPFPESARLILARHKFAIERVHRGMKSTLRRYNKGYLKTQIDGVEYKHMVIQNQEHIIKAPNVVLNSQRLQQ